MLTKVEARTQLGTLLIVELEDITDGLIVENIDGLDPVKATLTSSSFAQLDGAQFQSSKRDPRNILLTLGLEPDYATQTVRDLRQKVYSFFMPKSQVELRFYIDDLVVDITAIVESLSSPLFVKEPQITISLMCFDPDFVELDPIVIEGDTVDDSTEFLVTYPGTVETGIEFQLMVDRALEEFTIYHKTPDDVVHTLDFAGTLEADDILTIVTVSGSKEVTLLRSSTESSVLYGMSPQSKWIELLQGDNYLRVFAEGDPIPFTITYTPRHGGL